MNAPASPIAVTGAGGFVGAHLVRRLLDDGLPVRAVVRATADARRLREAGCEVALADVRHRASLDEALAGCRAVVHLVAIIRETREASFQEVNVDGTTNVVAAARDAGLLRCVHLSALGAGPGAPPYLRSKWAGEEAVRRGGVPYVIFRPSLLIGRGGVSGQFADVVRFGPWYPFVLLGGGRRLFALLAALISVVPVLGSGRYRAMYLALADLLAAVRQAVERDDVVNETFELGGPEILSYDEMIARVAGALGLRRRTVHLPWPVARAVVRAFAWLPNPPITPDEFRSLIIDNVCDNSRAVQAFRLSLQPFDQALRQALAGDGANG